MYFCRWILQTSAQCHSTIKHLWNSITRFIRLCHAAKYRWHFILDREVAKFDCEGKWAAMKCSGCRILYDWWKQQATGGEDSCPAVVFIWDFLLLSPTGKYSNPVSDSHECALVGRLFLSAVCFPLDWLTATQFFPALRTNTSPFYNVNAIPYKVLFLKCLF